MFLHAISIADTFDSAAKILEIGKFSKNFGRSICTGLAYICDISIPQNASKPDPFLRRLNVNYSVHYIVQLALQHFTLLKLIN